MKFTENLENIIDDYGVKESMRIIDIMPTQELETIEELNDCLIDELTYLAEND